VQAFAASTGAKLFETTLSQFFGGNAVIAGGTLYAATENSRDLPVRGWTRRDPTIP
jgi:hypothetical protein